MHEPRTVPGLVTVILPFFNRERFLAAAIASILGQRHSKIEILLVDDGSTDQSRCIAESFRDPRIRLLPLEKRRGQPQAINRALPLARGEWISFFDSDDVMTPRSLEARTQFLKQNPEAPAVMGRVGRLITIPGKTLPRRHPIFRVHHSSLRVSRRMARTLGGLPAELFVWGDCPLSSLNATLFRNETVKQLGRIDERFPLWNDREYLLRLTCRQPVPFLDVPVLWYRVHGGNLSFRVSGKRLVHPKAAAMERRLRVLYWNALRREENDAG